MSRLGKFTCNHSSRCEYWKLVRGSVLVGQNSPCQNCLQMFCELSNPSYLDKLWLGWWHSSRFNISINMVRNVDSIIKKKPQSVVDSFFNMSNEFRKRFNKYTFSTRIMNDMLPDLNVSYLGLQKNCDVFLWPKLEYMGNEKLCNPSVMGCCECLKFMIPDFNVHQFWFLLFLLVPLP